VYSLQAGDSTHLWHLRLGHPSKNALHHAHKHLKGIPILQDHASAEAGPCKGCQLGKAHQRAFLPSSQRSDRVLGLIHTDLCEFPILSCSHAKWMITFIDDASGFSALHFLRSKADAVAALQSLITWAEAQTGYRLRSIRSDRGGEYINQSLRTFLSSRGIEHQTSVPRTPQQNGRAEHFNRTILEKSEAMHQHACLPPSFWQDAVETSLHIYNRQPMRRLNWSTPIFKWNGEKPDVSYFKVFGSQAYVFVLKEK
jgi:transposase InsO family protein